MTINVYYSLTKCFGSLQIAQIGRFIPSDSCHTRRLCYIITTVGEEYYPVMHGENTLSLIITNVYEIM